jgi:hypothetical protein
MMKAFRLVLPAIMGVALFMAVWSLFRPAATLMAGNSNLAGTGAPAVYVLSGGEANSDQAVLDALSAGGYSATLGVAPSAWDGSQANLEDYAAVVFLNSYNYSDPEMPITGQVALANYIGQGGGMVTGEWIYYNVGFENYYQELSATLPATITDYVNITTTTFISSYPDPILNAGLPVSFTFGLFSYDDGTESILNPKEGAVSFYDSTATEASGLVGWNYGGGRVASFSIMLTDVELADPNLERLFINTVDWVTFSRVYLPVVTTQ